MLKFLCIFMIFSYGWSNSLIKRPVQQVNKSCLTSTKSSLNRGLNSVRMAVRDVEQLRHQVFQHKAIISDLDFQEMVLEVSQIIDHMKLLSNDRTLGLTRPVKDALSIANRILHQELSRLLEPLNNKDQVISYRHELISKLMKFEIESLDYIHLSNISESLYLFMNFATFILNFNEQNLRVTQEQYDAYTYNEGSFSIVERSILRRAYSRGDVKELEKEFLFKDVNKESKAARIFMIYSKVPINFFHSNLLSVFLLSNVVVSKKDYFIHNGTWNPKGVFVHDTGHALDRMAVEMKIINAELNGDFFSNGRDKYFHVGKLFFDDAISDQLKKNQIFNLMLLFKMQSQERLLAEVLHYFYFMPVHETSFIESDQGIYRQRKEPIKIVGFYDIADHQIKPSTLFHYIKKYGVDDKSLEETFQNYSALVSSSDLKKARNLIATIQAAPEVVFDFNQLLFGREKNRHVIGILVSLYNGMFRSMMNNEIENFNPSLVKKIFK